MAYTLSLHAGYGCRHAGACCEIDWHIPVDPPVLHVVGALGQRLYGRPGMVPLEGSPDPVVERDPAGTCVFFDAAGGRLCHLHRDAGLTGLPSACRLFPRVVLRDDRGTFIGISHFCPTAALLLLTDEPVAVVEASGALLVPGLEGFEAGDALPPLLRPGLLTDLAGYAAWEALCVQTLSSSEDGYAAALGRIAAATWRAIEWRPGRGSLAGWMQKAFEAAAAAQPDPFGAALQRHRAAALLGISGTRFPAFAHSDERTWSAGRQALAPFDGAVRRYLAARVFACQVAYEGQGLLTVVEWLRTCLAVLQHEAGARVDQAGAIGVDPFLESVRQADLVLLHQADSRAFARRAARVVEGAPS